jgi:hypothetical protein
VPRRTTSINTVSAGMQDRPCFHQRMGDLYSDPPSTLSSPTGFVQTALPDNFTNTRINMSTCYTSHTSTLESPTLGRNANALAAHSAAHCLAVQHLPHVPWLQHGPRSDSCKHPIHGATEHMVHPCGQPPTGPKQKPKCCPQGSCNTLHTRGGAWVTHPDKVHVGWCPFQPNAANS